MQRDGETPDAETPDPSVGNAEPEVHTPEPDPLHSQGFFRDTLNQGPVPPPRKREGFFRAPKQDDPVLITEAAPSLEQQHRDRVRRYSILMGFRIPCLLLAALAYGEWHNAWISMAIIGVSVPLPWIAVLVANDRPPRRKDEPSRWDARRAELKALESGRNRSIDG
jgi:hypothetical protein